MRKRAFVLAAVVWVVLTWVSVVLSNDSIPPDRSTRPMPSLMSVLHRAYPCRFPGREELQCEAQVPLAKH